MKPKNNHRWNRCIIEEDYCLTHGHGEQFFRAFDRAFKLQPIELQSSRIGKGKADELGKPNVRPLGEDKNNGAYFRILPEAVKVTKSEREIANKPHCSRSAGSGDIQSHSVARSITNYISTVIRSLNMNNGFIPIFALGDKGSNPFGTIHSKPSGVIIPRPLSMATTITPPRKKTEGRGCSYPLPPSIRLVIANTIP